MKLTIIIGLPGSGKTTLAKTLTGIILDDLSVNGGIDLLKASKNESNIIITDPWLCLETARVSAKLFFKEILPDHEVEWIYFENNPRLCLKNSQNRDDGRKVDGTIRLLTKMYKIPPNSDVRPVWSNENESAVPAKT